MPTRSQLTSQVPQADCGGVLVAEHQPSPPLLPAADEEVVQAENRPAHRVGWRGVDGCRWCQTDEGGRRRWQTEVTAEAAEVTEVLVVETLRPLPLVCFITRVAARSLLRQKGPSHRMGALGARTC